MTLTAEDRLDLATLVASYAAAVDTRDFERVARLFVPDGELVSPDPPRSLAPVRAATGHEAIVTAMLPLTELAGTVHHVTGSVWQAAGAGDARGRTTGIAHHLEAGERPRSFVWHVVYDDACRRTDEGWRFVRRAITIRFTETRPVALLG